MESQREIETTVDGVEIMVSVNHVSASLEMNENSRLRVVVDSVDKFNDYYKDGPNDFMIEELLDLIKAIRGGIKMGVAPIKEEIIGMETEYKIEERYLYQEDDFTYAVYRVSLNHD